MLPKIRLRTPKNLLVKMEIRTIIPQMEIKSKLRLKSKNHKIKREYLSYRIAIGMGVMQASTSAKCNPSPNNKSTKTKWWTQT